MESNLCSNSIFLTVTSASASARLMEGALELHLPSAESLLHLPCTIMHAITYPSSCTPLQTEIPELLAVLHQKLCAPSEFFSEWRYPPRQAVAHASPPERWVMRAGPATAWWSYHTYSKGMMRKLLMSSALCGSGYGGGICSCFLVSKPACFLESDGEHVGIDIREPACLHAITKAQKSEYITSLIGRLDGNLTDRMFLTLATAEKSSICKCKLHNTSRYYISRSCPLQTAVPPL